MPRRSQKMTGGAWPLSWILNGVLWNDLSHPSYHDTWFLQHDILKDSIIYPNNYLYSSSYSYVPTEYVIENFVSHELPLTTWIGDSLYNAIYNNYPLSHFYSFYDYLLAKDFLTPDYILTVSSSNSDAKDEALKELRNVIQHVLRKILEGKNVNSKKSQIQGYLTGDESKKLCKAIVDLEWKVQPVIKEYVEKLKQEDSYSSQSKNKINKILSLIDKSCGPHSKLSQVFAQQTKNAQSK